jgi:hypothetical protein
MCSHWERRLSTPPPADQPEPSNPSGGQVSGQPWSTPSGDPLSVEPYQPPVPPPPPAYSTGQAPLPPSGASEWAPPGENDYPPTTQFEPPVYGQPQYAPPPGYGPPPGYPPGYGPPPPPAPRKSNIPLVAVIVAVAILLCGGTVTAGVLVVRNVTDRAKEAVKPITDPTVPAVPTNLPTLPTDLPGLGGDSGKKITVGYQVSGDGPAEILYAEKLGATPKRVSKAKLPFKVTTTMDGTAFVLLTAVRGDGDGSISCRATVDGQEVAQSTREGRFASVTCSKLVFG